MDYYWNKLRYKFEKAKIEYNHYRYSYGTGYKLKKVESRAFLTTSRNDTDQMRQDKVISTYSLNDRCDSSGMPADVDHYFDGFCSPVSPLLLQRDIPLCKSEEALHSKSHEQHSSDSKNSEFELPVEGHKPENPIGESVQVTNELRRIDRSSVADFAKKRNRFRMLRIIPSPILEMVSSSIIHDCEYAIEGSKKDVITEIGNEATSQNTQITNAKEKYSQKLTSNQISLDAALISVGAVKPNNKATHLKRFFDDKEFNQEYNRKTELDNELKDKEENGDGDEKRHEDTLHKVAVVSLKRSKDESRNDNDHKIAMLTNKSLNTIDANDSFRISYSQKSIANSKVAIHDPDYADLFSDYAASYDENTQSFIS